MGETPAAGPGFFLTCPDPGFWPAGALGSDEAKASRAGSARCAWLAFALGAAKVFCVTSPPAILVW
ncbi:MAG TPA: hypothetical protein DGG94_12705 [Micromonosporaceae bacterium]|nr:hypothetical protein [Micromonosporaceae bacterium]HCU50639.1 hypothetical protein [Micromonosporaceae bacterium]